MKGPVSHKGYEERYKYQEFIKRYFQEEGITYSNWKEIQPLYLRYRARCLKMQPESYEQFKNLCLFESNRKTKYDIKGELKEGEKVGWNTQSKKEATGSRDVICRIRRNYKLNYKAPPKKEDFEVATDYRLAYKDWSYLKDTLADYEATKLAIQKIEKQTIEAGVESRNLTAFPWLIKYALRCLEGTIPIEAYPEVLNSYREELIELLEKQKKEKQV